MSQLNKCLKFMPFFLGGGGYFVWCTVTFIPPPIDLHSRHLSGCDNIDMIEMHHNSCSCFTKTFFLLEYWEIKLNDCFWAHFAK